MLKFNKVLLASDFDNTLVYTQGALTTTEIWVDKETGVNYLFHADGNAGGLTPLPDKDGRPVITPVKA